MHTDLSQTSGAKMRQTTRATRSFFGAVRKIASNQKAYRRLIGMDDRMLRDMGLTRDQVRQHAQWERDLFRLPRDY